MQQNQVPAASIIKILPPHSPYKKSLSEILLKTQLMPFLSTPLLMMMTAAWTHPVNTHPPMWMRVTPLLPCLHLCLLTMTPMDTKLNFWKLPQHGIAFSHSGPYQLHWCHPCPGWWLLNYHQHHWPTRTLWKTTSTTACTLRPCWRMWMGAMGATTLTTIARTNDNPALPSRDNDIVIHKPLSPLSP